LPVTGINAVSPVYYREELIGRVHVVWSRQPISALRSGLWPEILAITVCGIVVQFLLVWILTRRFLRIPLNALVRSLHELARGGFDVAIPESRHRELHLLLVEAKRMAVRIKDRTERLQAEITERCRVESELIDHRQHLEELVRWRTQELDSANSALREEMEERKRAQNAIINISTHERQRIGQDLHDTLGQEIVGARYLLASLHRAIATAAPQYSERLVQLSAMLSDIMEHARMMAHGLMVVDLREGGLIEALKASVDKTARLFAVDCRFKQDTPSVPDVDAVAAVQLCYIAQEAFNNAKRHGHASKIRVRLGWRNDTPVMLVTDNGTGFYTGGNASGMGLTIMRNRAESVGLQLRVWSRPGLGTCICCSLINDQRGPGGDCR
jgi:signal transduction histidine kinase